MRARARAPARAPHRRPARGRQVGAPDCGRYGGRDGISPGAVGEQLEREHQRRPQLWLGDELVDLAVGELASRGERVRDGRSAHPMAGKGYRRAWQREDNVRRGRQRRPCSPRDRVAEHADVGDPGRSRPSGGGGDALHPGQSGEPFLHPAAAGGHERDDRPAQCDGAREGVGDLLAAGDADRAADEATVERDQHHVDQPDPGVAADHGVGLAGVGTRAGELRAVARPGEWIGRLEIGVELGEGVRDGDDRGARAAVGDRRREGVQGAHAASLVFWTLPISLRGSAER